MVSMTDIQDLADRIARVYDSEKIIDFDSRAQGSETPLLSSNVRRGGYDKPNSRINQITWNSAS